VANTLAHPARVTRVVQGGRSESLAAANAGRPLRLRATDDDSHVGVPLDEVRSPSRSRSKDEPAGSVWTTAPETSRGAPRRASGASLTARSARR
jgi:hypothetical protein